jgi:hypothetical protein
MPNKTEQPTSHPRATQENPDEQAALAELRTDLPDFVSQIEIGDLNGRREIEISFTKPMREIKSWDARAFFGRFNKILAEHGLETGNLQSSGGNRESYLLNKLKINGTTNWRRWLYFPENMSKQVKELLDVMAEDIGQQRGSDAAEKFCNFVEDAHGKGLITDEERQKIMNELYQAQNVS